MTQFDINKTSGYNLARGSEEEHIPVLLEQTLDFLSPKKGESYLDLTAGYGGHAAAVIGRTFQPNRATLVDRDQNAVDYILYKFKDSGIKIIKSDFYNASSQLLDNHESFNMILVDLGVSSPQFDKAERGFSFKNDGPLDMRMDNSQKLSAYEVVNSYPEGRLVEILKEYGEEPKARKIAAKIVSNRPIKSTAQLATIVAHAWPGRSKVHPATRTFQAIRIEVNQELKQLRDSLELWMELLAPEGRLVVISFHSLEDAIVKRFFADNSGKLDSSLVLLTKKPITGNENEIAFNPRARSAKLRAVVKK